MREIVFMLTVTVAIAVTTYMTMLLALAFAGCLMFLKCVPEWTWTVLLLSLTVATVRGLRYSLE